MGMKCILYGGPQDGKEVDVDGPPDELRFNDGGIETGKPLKECGQHVYGLNVVGTKHAIYTWQRWEPFMRGAKRR